MQETRGGFRILRQQGEAEAILVNAHDPIGSSLGKEATAMRAVDRYIEAYGELAKKSTSLLPSNVANPAGIIALNK
ncbi:hypothetical protein V6N13_086776 [Hibiscus sabdariffa]|uniref:STML2-like C-terminal extension domain-containing protein n=1 Tax=Hibiscus sabdariffa TaxID=183260 RepID=A0ABR2FUT1_9ROSI